MTRDQAHETAVRIAAARRGVRVIETGTTIFLKGPGCRISCKSFRDIRLADLENAEPRDVDVRTGAADRVGPRESW